LAIGDKSLKTIWDTTARNPLANNRNGAVHRATATAVPSPNGIASHPPPIAPPALPIADRVALRVVYHPPPPPPAATGIGGGGGGDGGKVGGCGGGSGGGGEEGGSG
jgi:hypothetical protein